MTLQNKVLDVLRKNQGEFGLTSREIHGLLPDSGFSSVSASVSALCKIGMIEKVSDNFKAGFKYRVTDQTPEAKTETENEMTINVKVDVVFRWEV